MEELYELRTSFKKEYDDFMKLYRDFNRNRGLFALYAVILIIESIMLVVLRLTLTSPADLSAVWIFLMLFALAVSGINVYYCYEAHVHAEWCKTLANRCLKNIEEIDRLLKVREYGRLHNP